MFVLGRYRGCFGLKVVRKSGVPRISGSEECPLDLLETLFLFFSLRLAAREELRLRQRLAAWRKSNIH